MKRRVVYMGTPEFACPALEMLAGRDDAEIALVVTQPDRAAGRGRKLQSPPVRILADQLGLSSYQATTLRTAAQRERIVAAQPDLIVVAAFGVILGTSILNLPAHGCVNLHASLLPKYRGASPISAAILAGEDTTGVTLMRMERGLDTGPMLAQQEVEISGQDTTESLTIRLAQLAADLLDASLHDLFTGALESRPQPDGATLTRPMVKSDGCIDWTQSVALIERQVRAMWPWPRAWTSLPDGLPFQIHQATIDDSTNEAETGAVVVDRDGLRIRAGDGWLRIGVGQLPGGKALTGLQLAPNQLFRNGVVVGALAPEPIFTPLFTPAGSRN